MRDICTRKACMYVYICIHTSTDTDYRHTHTQTCVCVCVSVVCACGLDTHETYDRSFDVYDCLGSGDG